MPRCVAILAMLDGDRRFGALLDAFFSRTRNNRGERVVLPVRDYLRGDADGVAAETFSGRLAVGEERPVAAADGGNLMELLVEQALRQDDADGLRALKLRLYDLRQPEATAPLVARIDRRLRELAEPKPTTQNIFNEGSSLFNESTLNSPVFGMPSGAPQGRMLPPGVQGGALEEPKK